MDDYATVYGDNFHRSHSMPQLDNKECSPRKVHRETKCGLRVLRHSHGDKEIEDVQPHRKGYEYHT